MDEQQHFRCITREEIMALPDAIQATVMDAQNYTDMERAEQAIVELELVERAIRMHFECEAKLLRERGYPIDDKAHEDQRITRETFAATELGLSAPLVRQERFDYIRRVLEKLRARDNARRTKNQGMGANTSNAERKNHAAGKPVIYSCGERLYKVDDGEPFMVDPREDNVLQAFVGYPALDGKKLTERSKEPHAVQILRRLKAKYHGELEPAIRFPGGKDAGGYKADVRN